METEIVSAVFRVFMQTKINEIFDSFIIKFNFDF